MDVEEQYNTTLKTPAPVSRTPSPGRSPVSKEFERTSGLCRVFNPPKLEKKHSSGDLISRLKTRKILGVGETDNGDIHRSKISQVLGHNEHLYVRLPTGFWLAHAFIAICITLEAVIFILSPSLARSLTLISVEQDISPAASRITGAALCGMAVFVCSLIGTSDKYYAKTVLLSVLVYQVMTCILCAASVLEQGGFGDRCVKSILCLRAIIILTCLWFLNEIASYSPCRGSRTSYKNKSSNMGQKDN